MHHSTIDLSAAYQRLWTSEPTPDLDAFLATAGPAATVQLSMLARLDQALRWRQGDHRLSEDYLEKYPVLQSDHESAVDLIYHEYLLRKKSAEPPSLEDFVRRFPRHAAAITEQVGLQRLLAEAENDTRLSCPVCHHEFEPAADTAGNEHVCPVCGSNFTIRGDDSIGWHIDGQPTELGKYTLIAPVGVGSFGTVYQARDRELDRIVAIKVPRANHLNSPLELERFQREARSLAQLRHPAIISVHEIGQWKQVPFLVSEFVEGTTLADRLSSRRLSPRDSAQLIATVADALHYAHEMGVVHRDVKPANIMLDDKLAPRLMDFGLARRDGCDVTMTLDGQVLGTPAYMSPEQVRGDSHKVDGRTDVYSLGVPISSGLKGPEGDGK